MHSFRRACLIAATLAVAARPALAATVTIINSDGPGEGFNDSSPATPVGGNPGTTVGAQRLHVFQYAADLWGRMLPGNVQIRVHATFDPLTCGSTFAILGSAGPSTMWRDFAGAPLPAHWYPVALANRLADTDLYAGDDIGIQFNSGLGTPTCMPVGWYYGVDGNE